LLWLDFAWHCLARAWRSDLFFSRLCVAEAACPCFGQAWPLASGCMALFCFAFGRGRGCMALLRLGFGFMALADFVLALVVFVLALIKSDAWSTPPFAAFAI